MSANPQLTKKVGDLAAAQSIAEVGLGSILHSLHIPFSGHFLSINQSVLLSFAAKGATGRKEAASICSGMATVVALLKSLSPAGKKLLPMLAIATQGLLFSTGLLVFGCNMLGVAAGAALLSVWGFVQPLLVAWLLFGQSFFDGLIKLWDETAKILGFHPEIGFQLVLAVFSLKATLCVALTVWAFCSKAQTQNRYWKWLSLAPAPSSKTTGQKHSGLKGAFFDLLNPWFLVSLTLALLLFFFIQNKNLVDGFLYGLRVLSVSFVFFWLLRSLPASWIEKALKRFPVLEVAYKEVVSKLSRT